MDQTVTKAAGQSPVMSVGSVEAVEVRASGTNAEPNSLMEVVLSRDNLMRAYQRVCRNKGAAGVDHMSVDALKQHLQQHWPVVRERLLAGTYQPQTVRWVSIPKPQGGERLLGIPTVQDRLIQQALHQVLSPVFEPIFSDSSYGFRPGRSAHQAVRAMQAHVNEGHRWVVDIDLAQFFDRVNHDILMSLVAKHVQDKRVLRLIRRYLKVGVMDGGVVSPCGEGTPQGGPLSPLLSNILLTELDRELERRGHRFCRYADDCNIYVASEQAGQRVMNSVTRFLEQRLRLQVNLEKSAVDRPWKRSFLGYSLTWHKQTRLRIAHCAEESAATAGQTTATAQEIPWSRPATHDSAVGASPSRLGGLLSAIAGSSSAGDAGRLGASQAATGVVATVETSSHSGEESDEVRVS